MELQDYFPIAILLLVAFLFGSVSRLLSSLLHPKNPTPEKLDPYECGIIPERDAPERFPVQFYLVAMIFIAFDIEVIFLYPWAVLVRRLGAFGIVEMAVFVAIVFIAYGYIRREGVFEWAPRKKLDRAELLRRYREEAQAARVQPESEAA
ncbi:MAG: NADH-quinone oxidoreductase subunit A [Actinobacteria bacterium ATB1]|nr:NADH-quinone oxidoreductase subunit A [Actinobacteria bacterium ATB1]